MIKSNSFKTLILSLLTMVVTGCANDMEPPTESSNSLAYKITGSETPESLERVNGVGWGYDANTYYADPRGVKEQIFSIQKLKNLSEELQGELVVGDEPYNMSTSFVCIGENSTEYSENLSVEASIDLNIPFAFSLDLSAKFSQSDMESSEYYFTTKRYKYVSFQRTLGVGNILAAVEVHKDVFTDSFNAYLSQLINSGGKEEYIKEFVKVFGNTYVWKSEIGGRVDYDMSIKKSSSLSVKDVELSIEAGFLSMFGMSISQTQKDALTRAQENGKVSVSAKGGNVTILGKALLNGEKSDSVSLVNWTKSITSKNAQMVDCQLHPIWELVPDKKVAAKIERYVTGNSSENDAQTYPQPIVMHYKFPVPEFEEGNTLVKVAWASGRPAIEFCREWLPAYSYRKVTMAYPIIDNVPDYSRGLYVGENDSIYLDGNNLSSKGLINSEYGAGSAAKDVLLTYSGKSYKLVKIGKSVWTRDYLSNITSNAGYPMSEKQNEQYNYLLKNGIVLYNGNSNLSMSDYMPVNWRLPSSTEVEELNSLFNACDTNLEDGNTGLDLKLMPIYDQYGSVVAKEKDVSFLLSGRDNQIISFRKMDQVKLESSRYLTPVRMVRASTYRYK